MSKEEIKQVEVDEIENKETEELDEQEYSAKDLFDEIGLQEECKRIQFQDEPRTEITKEVKNSKLYKDITEKAYIIGESLQILLGYGVDYSNAMTISNNLIQNAYDIEKARVQAVQANNSQI